MALTFSTKRSGDDSAGYRYLRTLQFDFQSERQQQQVISDDQ